MRKNDMYYKYLIQIMFSTAVAVGFMKYLSKKGNDTTMGKLDFSGRDNSTKTNYWDNDSKNNYSKKKSDEKNAMYFTSKIQLILGQKEKAEDDAATLLGEYIQFMSKEFVDEKRLMKSLEEMLRGFDLEERNRILMKALIRASYPAD